MAPMGYSHCTAITRGVPAAAWHRMRLLLVTGVLVFSGCTSDSDQEPRVVQPGAPGETSTVVAADEVPELELSEPTEADVQFVAGMIDHHAQAIRMTSLVGERTESTDLPLFAERLEISQQDEIALMEKWLEAREETEASHGHDGHLMPGMLTEEQFAELEAASGADFDRLFVEYMIYHHVGAIQMVEELLAGGGGQEPELYQLISHIDADQRIEINRMQGLLAELDSSS